MTRNIYRKSGKAFSGDSIALSLSKQLLPKIFDMPYHERTFVLMPLMHSENPADGEECLRLFNEIKNRLVETGNTDLLGSADGFIKFA